MTDKQDMFIHQGDTTKGVVDGHDKKYVRNTQRNYNVTQIVTNLNRRSKQPIEGVANLPYAKSPKSPCQVRSYKNLSTSLETLEPHKTSAERLYCAQEPVCKVPRSYLRHGEGFVKK